MSFILQSAIFNFQSLLTVILLLICTCAYIRALAPSLLDKNKTGYDEILNADETATETLLPLKIKLNGVIVSFEILKQHGMLLQ